MTDTDCLNCYMFKSNWLLYVPLELILKILHPLHGVYLLIRCQFCNEVVHIITFFFKYLLHEIYI